ncbi:MAG: YkgJ family cysteine cluster protein [Candidatus Omnitrophota bacterium]
MSRTLDLEKCKVCADGICCREGVELTKEELKRIVRFAPGVKKPWFRRLKANEGTTPEDEFETVIKNKRCVFQDENKRCMVYPVRPKYCAEFPLEGGKVAEFYDELCGRLHD